MVCAPNANSSWMYFARIPRLSLPKVATANVRITIVIIRQRTRVGREDEIPLSSLADLQRSRSTGTFSGTRLLKEQSSLTFLIGIFGIRAHQSRENQHPSARQELFQNWDSSVEPLRAAVERVSPAIVLATLSKYPAPANL
jgi:hypothetical protein